MLLGYGGRLRALRFSQLQHCYSLYLLQLPMLWLRIKQEHLMVPHLQQQVVF